MDDAMRLTTVRQLLDIKATNIEQRHALYHDDAVVEFPQSKERFEGKQNILAWRRQYPATVEGKIRRIMGHGDVWVTEGAVRYDAARGTMASTFTNSAATRSAAKPSTSPKRSLHLTGAHPGARRGRMRSSARHDPCLPNGLLDSATYCHYVLRSACRLCRIAAKWDLRSMLAPQCHALYHVGHVCERSPWWRC